MPYNVTLDDISPLVTYTGEWVAADKTSPDIYAARYSGTTFHASQTTGARASFEFNGTAVYIFGSRRVNHGYYNVTLDGGEVQRFDGYSPTVDGVDRVFQVPLYVKTGLANGLHSIVLTNDGTPNRPYFDVDMVTWTSDDSQGRNKTIDDSDSGWTYTPSAAWGTTSGYVGDYYARTEHLTNAGGASASLTFEGTGIYLYGGTLDNHGTYNVQIDNQPPRIGLNGSAPGYHYNIPLFYADGLGPGTHKITVTNTDDGKFLDIDYVNIIQSAPTSIAGPTVVTKSKAPVIAGIVSGVVIVAALMAAWFFLRRRKQRRTGPLDLLTEEQEPKPYGLPPMGYGPGRINANTSTIPTLAYTPAFNTGPVQPPSQPETSQGSHPPTHVNRPAPQPNRKGQPVVVQRTEPRGERTADELRETRMQVQGRPQDWGTMSDGSDTEYSVMLPPNYDQATGRFVPRQTGM